MLDNLSEIVTDIRNINSSHIKYDAPYILKVMCTGVKYEFLMNLKRESDKLIILGSGAYQPEKLKPPIFQRHAWMKHIPESTIFYNDPTLYNGKIRLGWGYGVKDDHYLENISKIFVKLLPVLGIPSGKVLFYGSSGGGFMSMILGGFIKGTKVIVNNPQTIVTNYYSGHVKDLMEIVHPGMTIEEICKSYNHKLSVPFFYKKIGYIPRIIYIQNVSCEHDMQNHLVPFISEMNSLDKFLIRLILFYIVIV
ncbi:hypothetical protein [Paenibacillus sp. JCM 10914]|uniref:hypothetical protein n=1 Tax=Paenibacillus sp. JCM 10914 TaxID=1236974 RepID=UPI0003CC564E|nr:hypothetical protein [Paenibacillus sp. JCM 10914]GAE09679.1 glycosyl transferase, group 2 family protein [Paenibacillus sp. JCM 10914]